MSDEPVLVFTVTGRPYPQGSKTARPVYVGRGPQRRFTGRVEVVESNAKRLHPWRDNVTFHAAEAAQRQGIRDPLDGPLRLDVTFLLPRPKSHYRTGRNGDLLTSSAPVFPIAFERDDLDKLLRGLMDAITYARVWHDDSQVVATQARKVYAELGEAAGARVRIDRITQSRFGAQLARPPEQLDIETLPIHGEVL